MKSDARRDEGARHGHLRSRARRETPATRRRRPGRGAEHRHRGLHGGGNLRAAVFGVNDGLVSNASLILGIAGASPDPHVVLLTGIAGMCAGAFAMATGEYVSVRSQRELFEYQIGLERDELAQYPEAEAQELALIYAAKGLRPEEASKLATKIVADPEHALDTLAREELGLNPDELGSPWGAAISSFLSFAVGALLPLAPFMAMSGPRTLPVAIGVTALALFARRRAAVALHRARRACARACGCWRWAGSQAPSRSRSAAWPVSRLADANPRAAAQAGARQIAAAASSLDLFRRDRRRRRRARTRATPSTVLSRRRRVPRARGVFAGVADPRARLDLRSARARRRRVLRASRRARGRGARADAGCASHRVPADPRRIRRPARRRRRSLRGHGRAAARRRPARSAGARRSSRRSSRRPAPRASTSARMSMCASSKAWRRAPASRTARCPTA